MTNFRLSADLTMYCDYILHSLVLQAQLNRHLLKPAVLDFKVPRGYQHLQPGVLLLRLAGLFHAVSVHVAEALPPRVDRLLAAAMPLGHLGHRIAVGLAQNAHRLPI